MRSSEAAYDQRRYPRVPLQYPVKVTGDCLGPRYLTGRTCNLSAGGVFVELGDDRPGLSVGARIAVALPRHPADMLLAADDTIPGTIVRTAPSPRGLGIRFDRPVTIAIPRG